MIRYSNQTKGPLSLPLPTQGSVLIEPGQTLRDSLVDDFGESWFDRFCGPDGDLAKQVTDDALQAASLSVGVGEVGMDTSAADKPRLTLEDIRSMGREQLLAAWDEYGIRPSRGKRTLTTLRRKLADGLGLL
jgi:hypothetical protein